MPLLASAGLGLIAGYGAVRLGLRSSMIFGALAMAVCAAAGAVFPTVPMLLGARILEGLGYLIVVVAAPTLIAREAARKDVPLALAIWGMFFTLGLSLAAFAGGALAGPFGWRGWYLSSAGLVAFAAVAALGSIPKDVAGGADHPDAPKTRAAMPVATWLLGAAFLGLTLLSLSILSLLPTFLVQQHGFTPGRAGQVTGSVALASIAGSLSYGVLARGLPGSIIAAGVGVALSVSAFLAFAEAAAPVQIIAWTAVAVFMSGVLVAQTFAAVPRVAGTLALTGPTNGLVAQLGSVGALAGPPALGAVISAAGWRALPFVVAGFALSYAALFILALRVAHR
ncbi:MAG: MFS transporter [Pseudomonadota bacterium]